MFALVLPQRVLVHAASRNGVFVPDFFPPFNVHYESSWCFSINQERSQIQAQPTTCPSQGCSVSLAHPLTVASLLVRRPRKHVFEKYSATARRSLVQSLPSRSTLFTVVVTTQAKPAGSTDAPLAKILHRHRAPAFSGPSSTNFRVLKNLASTPVLRGSCSRCF